MMQQVNYRHNTVFCVNHKQTSRISKNMAHIIRQILIFLVIVVFIGGLHAILTVSRKFFNRCL